jgi:hypothetical protein
MWDVKKFGLGPNVKPLGPFEQSQAILLVEIWTIWTGTHLGLPCKVALRSSTLLLAFSVATLYIFETL